MKRLKKFMILLILVLLVAAPAYSASSKEKAAKPSTTQTSKPAAKPATAKTEAKPSSKASEAVQAPVEAEPVKESQYAAGGNPEGWWNALWSNAQFSYDLFAKSTLLRGDNVIGGGLSMGVETEKFRFEGYGQADYFMKPFGGNGGLAGLELCTEIGVDAAWKFLEFWSFDIWAGCDIGYFTQLVKGLSYPPYDELVMGYSGLMIRPKLLTELKIAKYYGLTLGFYYQIPVYPAYSDYSGLGIMFSIC